MLSTRVRPLMVAATLCYGLALGSCKTVSGRGSDLSGMEVSSGLLSRTELTSAADYTEFSQPSNGLISNGRSVKFLVDFKKDKSRNLNKDKDKTNAVTIHFLNSNYTGRCSPDECHKYHYNFAKEVGKTTLELDAFNRNTYFTNTKFFAAGTLSTYDLGAKGLIYAIQLFPQDAAQGDTITQIASEVSKAFKIPHGKLVFLSTGNQQTTDARVTQALAAMNIEVMSLNQVIGSSPYIPMHPGEAWGYLRVFPKDENTLSATDVVVFDELPLDLTVVAAVMTKAFQDTNSHINLKSKERNTPNMILRDAGPDNPLLAPHIDKPVHIKVEKKGWTIESTTPEIVAQKLKDRMNRPWVKIPWTSSRTLLAYPSMCTGKAGECLKLSAVYGSKASNLGFLKETFKNRKVPGKIKDPATGKIGAWPDLAYDPVPTGLGVPLQFYKDIVDFPSNAALKAKIEDFTKREMAGELSGADRTTISEQIRTLYMNAEVPPDNLAAVKAFVTQTDPNVPEWKVRSSANAEDIEGFDGAGLHDSYSYKVANEDKPDHSCQLVISNADDPGELTKYKVKPKTLACAMKGVYASLWNKRAIEERSFAHIDHTSVAMGLAFVPNYDTVSPVVGNSVVVTRVINSADVMGYSLSIQKDNNTVTNPTPGTWSETTIAASASEDEEYTLSTTRFAKPTADATPMTTTVLSTRDTLLMVALTRKVEEAYCIVKTSYYLPNDRNRTSSCREIAFDPEKPKALDMEMKVLGNGEIVIKQVREFAGK